MARLERRRLANRALTGGKTSSRAAALGLGQTRENGPAPKEQTPLTSVSTIG